MPRGGSHKNCTQEAGQLPTLLWNVLCMLVLCQPSAGWGSRCQAPRWQVAETRLMLQGSDRNKMVLETGVSLGHTLRQPQALQVRLQRFLCPAPSSLSWPRHHSFCHSLLWPPGLSIETLTEHKSGISLLQNPVEAPCGPNKVKPLTE